MLKKIESLIIRTEFNCKVMMHSTIWYHLYAQSKTAAKFVKIESRKVALVAEK